MVVCETERLRLRHYTKDDAEFIIKLLNETEFIANIGDKGVRTNEDALKYLVNGPIFSYRKFGFGLNMVELKSDATSIGMCGLIKREELDDVDIGYAFLSEHFCKGYAYESSKAVMSCASKDFNLNRVIAVTNPDNLRSVHLLEKLNFEYEGLVDLYNTQNKLFGFNF